MPFSDHENLLAQMEELLKFLLAHLPISMEVETNHYGNGILNEHSQ